MRVLEEGKDAILNRVVMVCLTEKINLNKDLKEVMSGTMLISGGAYSRQKEQLA